MVRPVGAGGSKSRPAADVAPCALLSSTAQTCGNKLYLPEYDTAEELRSGLAEAFANTEAGGLHELVEMVRKDASLPAAGEAAGALRSLSSDFPAGCKAIVEANGVEALVAMVEQGEAGSPSAVRQPSC